MSEAAAAPEPPQRSKAELHADIEKTRAELKATLDAIEFKLNLPKQARHAAHRLKVRVKTLRTENPGALVAGVAGAAALVAGVAVLGYRFAASKK